MRKGKKNNSIEWRKGEQKKNEEKFTKNFVKIKKD